MAKPLTLENFSTIHFLATEFSQNFDPLTELSLIYLIKVILAFMIT